MTDLTAECSVRDGVTVVTAKGECDIYAAASLLHLLGPLTTGPLVLDLEGVSFVDRSGLGVLFTSANAATAAGHRMAACGVQEGVRKVFRTSGLDRVLPVRESVEEAVKAVTGG